MDELTLPELQLTLNQLLYTDIYKYLMNMRQVTDDEQSFQLMLSALSTNLGLLIGQLSDANRESYSKICKEIIDKSCKQHIKLSDEYQYGQIGHA